MKGVKAVDLKKLFLAVFFLAVWYIPRQTAPGGWFEKLVILRWSTFFIIPVLFLCFVLYKIRAGSKIFSANTLMPVVGISLAIVFSSLINHSSFIASIFTFLVYLRYPLFFLVLLNIDPDEDLAGSFIRLFFLLLFVQIPEVFYRFFVLGIRWDYISWSLGPWGSFDLGVYMLYATAFLSAGSLILGIRPAYIFLIFCFFLIALMGEIKMFLFSAPIVAFFIACACVNMKIPKRRFFTVIAVISAAFILCIQLYGKLFPESAEVKKIESVFFPVKATLNDSRSAGDANGKRLVPDSALDPGAQAGRQDMELSEKLERVAAFFELAYSPEFKKSKMLFGYGPGSSLEGAFMAKKGEFYKFPVRYKNQLSETFIDLGFAGLAAYYWLLICFLSVYIKHFRIENAGVYIVLNRALLGIWVFYAILGPFYDLVWRHDAPNFIFFFLNAVLYYRFYGLKNESIVN